MNKVMMMIMKQQNEAHSHTQTNTMTHEARKMVKNNFTLGVK